MLEEIVGEAGRIGEDARAGRGDHLDRDRVERGGVGKIEGIRAGRVDALMGAAERLQDREP